MTILIRQLDHRNPRPSKMSLTFWRSAWVILVLFSVLECAEAGVWFDDIDDNISCPDKVSNRPNSDDWSISIWFQAPNVNVGSSLITKRMLVSPYNQMGIYIGDNTTSVNPAKKIVVILIGTSSMGDVWWAGTQNDIVDGKWHHVVLRRKGTSAEIWADGTNQALVVVRNSGTAPQNINNTNPWLIGDNGGGVHNGQITEIAMWRTYLSEQEIKQLARGRVKGLPLQIAATHLVAYWPLDDVSNNQAGDAKTFRDASGNNNHGTGSDGSNNTGLLGKAEEILSYPP